MYPGAFWDERFKQTDYVYGTAPNAFLAEQLPQLPVGRMLLPAEGEGRNAVYAAELGWDVHAVDYSREGIAKARRLATERGVSLIYDYGDLSTWMPPEGTNYDALGVFFFHAREATRHAVLRRLSGLVKVGGHLIMEVFSPEQIGHSSGGPKAVELMYTPEELRMLFPEYEWLHFESGKTVLDEGPYHQGEAYTIRMVGRKGTPS